MKRRFRVKTYRKEVRTYYAEADCAACARADVLEGEVEVDRIDVDDEYVTHCDEQEPDPD